MCRLQRLWWLKTNLFLSSLQNIFANKVTDTDDTIKSAYRHNIAKPNYDIHDELVKHNYACIVSVQQGSRDSLLVERRTCDHIHNTMYYCPAYHHVHSSPTSVLLPHILLHHIHNTMYYCSTYHQIYSSFRHILLLSIPPQPQQSYHCTIAPCTVASHSQQSYPCAPTTVLLPHIQLHHIHNSLIHVHLPLNYCPMYSCITFTTVLSMCYCSAYQNIHSSSTHALLLSIPSHSQ